MSLFTIFLYFCVCFNQLVQCFLLVTYLPFYIVVVARLETLEPRLVNLEKVNCTGLKRLREAEEAAKEEKGEKLHCCTTPPFLYKHRQQII